MAWCAAGEGKVAADLALGLAGERIGDHLRGPGAARPVDNVVFGCLPTPQLQDGVAPIALLVIHWRDWDLALSLELATDLTVEGVLLRLDGEEHIGPLG